MTTVPALEVRGLRKEFGGLVAVDGIDLEVAEGTVHVLIGPNGAGKTTCFNLLTRFLPLTAGTITYRGRDVTRVGPAELARQGVVRSFQISAVFPKLTVLQNVRLGLQHRCGTIYSLAFWRSRNSLAAFDGEAEALLSEVGLASERHRVAAELPYGQRRMLELSMAMTLNPTLLLLDEPTSGLGREDVGKVVSIIAKIATARTVLMVEHNMGVVASLADRVTVLVRGKILAEGSYQEMSADPRVRQAYLGGNHV